MPYIYNVMYTVWLLAIGPDLLTKSREALWNQTNKNM